MAGNKFTTQNVLFKLINNAGGLNTTASPLNVADNESTDCLNVDFSKFGSILKRNGYYHLNATAANSGAAIQGLYWYESSSGTDFLVCKAGTKFMKMDWEEFDGTWDDITGALTFTDVDTDLVCFDTFLDTCLATNGVAIPWKWTGAGNADVMTLPTDLTTAKYLCVYNGYTILANVTVAATLYASRIYWSAIDSISTWDDADFRDINKADGQDITGIKVLGDKLVIFKSRAIWVGQFTGDSDIPFVFTKTPSSVGCVSHHSIQEIDNGLMFLSADGYYYFDGVYSTKASDRISTTLQDTLEPTKFQYSTSCFQRDKNRYWAAHMLAGGSTHSRIVTWDSFNNAWSIYKGFTPISFAIVNTGGEERVYFGDYAGYVYRADYGTDDYPAKVQTAIDAYYYTKWFNFEDIVNKKGVPHITIYYQIATSTITFAYSYDFETADQYSITISLSTSSDVFDTGLFDEATFAGSGGKVIRKDLQGRGRVVRFKFANSTLSQTMQIDGFGMAAYLETHV